jgi:hypothetical protein
MRVATQIALTEGALFLEYPGRAGGLAVIIRVSTGVDTVSAGLY